MGPSSPEIMGCYKAFIACAGQERLSERYKQDPKMSFVKKAIYTLAYGLHNMQQDLCGVGHVGVCPRLYPFNGSLFKVSYFPTS